MARDKRTYDGSNPEKSRAVHHKGFYGGTDAEIEMETGVAKAIQMGYRRIRMTVACPAGSHAAMIRQAFRNIECAIGSVHNTGMSKRTALITAFKSDLVTSCASLWAQGTCRTKIHHATGLADTGLRLDPSRQGGCACWAEGLL